MAKVKKWIESSEEKPKPEYDEAKREFGMAIGKPFIQLRIEVPTGFEDMRAEFLSLETDKDFLAEVEDLIKKRLIYEKRDAEET
ncbi:MAG: hypothetical protein JSV35_03950 [Candidatus Bathyarchaeota archaeon]|nr:MAG: hypothetical protein JSV35_03950 [Candidatus Bathyarchaeota archaeon]